MRGYLCVAADYAGKCLVPALDVLVELMGDHDQTGPVRVAAAKGVIDYALKLADKGEVSAATMERLDRLLEEMVCTEAGAASPWG